MLDSATARSTLNGIQAATNICKVSCSHLGITLSPGVVVNAVHCIEQSRDGVALMFYSMQVPLWLAPLAIVWVGRD